jgi:hypothetical protein
VIPPDLDDLACISYLLRRHDVAFPDNRNFVLGNRDGRGLFYTWLTPRWTALFAPRLWRAVWRQCLSPLKLYYFWKLNESAPDDVDCVVNANVLLYAGERAETRAVIDYLIGIVHRREEGICDKWHLNPLMFHYAVSRNFYAGLRALSVVREQSIERIVARAQPDGSIGENVLDTALAACALLNWGATTPELKSAIQFLLESQGTSGEWTRVALYHGGPKKYYGWGSEELTTGFCLEALLRYRANAATADEPLQDRGLIRSRYVTSSDSHRICKSGLNVPPGLVRATS